MDVVAQRIALVANGVVQNVILGEEGYQAPDGVDAIALDADSHVGPGWLYDGEAFTAPDPATPPPDPNGYLLASMGVFVGEGDPVGLIRGNEVLSRWPSFSTALLQRNWAVARATLAAAYSVGTITEGEHTALEALFADYHIPEA